MVALLPKDISGDRSGLFCLHGHDSVCLPVWAHTGEGGGLLAMSQFALLRHPAIVISDQSSPYGHVSRGANYTLTLPSIDLI